MNLKKIIMEEKNHKSLIGSPNSKTAVKVFSFYC